MSTVTARYMSDTNTFEALFLDNLSLVDRVSGAMARRQGLDPDESEDFAAWVRLRLLEDDFAILRKFRGESSIGTYLTVVISMLARDHRVQVQGRWRPSAEALRRGNIAIQLESLVYRKGYKLGEAIQLLRTSGVAVQSDHELTLLFKRLPVREPLRPAFSGSALLEEVVSSEHAENTVVRSEHDRARERILATVREWMGALPSDQQVMLHMKFWEGLSVADIAKGLHTAQKPLYRTLEKLLTRLRATLLAEGITPEHLHDMFEEVEL